MKTLIIGISTALAVSMAPAATAKDRIPLEAASGDVWIVERPSRGLHASAVRDAARIPRHVRPFAECVSDRESSGSYTARNPASSAQGRWQFLDNSWRRGLGYMVAARLKAHGMPKTAARQVREYLHDTPIAAWPGQYQDAGFVAVIASGGSHHWNGPGCNHLKP